MTELLGSRNESSDTYSRDRLKRLNGYEINAGKRMMRADKPDAFDTA
jgi:hypothetical protein